MTEPKRKLTKTELLMKEIEELNYTIQVLSDENAHGKRIQKELEAVIVDFQAKLEKAAQEREAFAKEKGRFIIELQDEIIGLQTHLDMAEAKSEQLQLELDQALAEELTPEEYSSINNALEETMPNNQKPMGPTNPFIKKAKANLKTTRVKMQGKAIHAGIHATERVLTQFSKDTVKMHAATMELEQHKTPEERMHSADKQHDLLSTIVTEGFGLAKQWLEFKAWKAMNDDEGEE